MEVITKEIKQQVQKQQFDPSKIYGVELIEKELVNSISDSSGVIREMCSHILSAGGKRIRPLLVLYSGMIFSDMDGDILQASVAAELIHMASLVHDDIIDNSSLRRNKPSINQLWGNQFAVLCGDYLFAKAFGILSGKRLIKSLDYMVEAIQSMCYGEILQAGDRFRHDISIDRYYDRITKKTAKFLECCCKSGASISGADGGQLKLIGEYGLNLGLAFQITDDILDFCGDVAAMGKPNIEDLREGNITLPVIFLLQDERYSQWLRQVIVEKEFSEPVMKEIVRALENSGTIELCFNMARSHIDKAKQCLSLLPQKHYTHVLFELTNMLQARKN